MNPRPNSSLAGALLPIALAVTLFAGSAAAETLRIAGTGGDLGTMRQLGAAFSTSHPGTTVKVLPSLGSGGGVMAVLAGAIGLAITSRPPNEKERAGGARATAYAKSAFVFVTHPDNPETAVTSAQAIAIHAGRVRTWPDGRQD